VPEALCKGGKSRKAVENMTEKSKT
jgi:hypothetical protein